MNSSTPVSITYITSSLQLSSCVEMLAQQSSFALDLEFDSNRHGYGVSLSLIQLAIPTACFVVDVLAGVDPQPLFALFADGSIEKLVHAPGEDLRLLHRLGCFPQNLFDTEVAARLLNYERTALAALVADKLGIVLDKSQQRSNWLLRPISPAQLEYAAADVVWLHALKEQLVAEAEAKGLLPFLQEEQALLSTTVHTVETKGDLLKPADRATFSPCQQHLLAGLLLYRDELARRIGRPPYQVLSEDAVRHLAAGNWMVNDPLTRRNLHPRYRNAQTIEALANRLQDLIAEANAQELSTKQPGRPRLTPTQQAVLRKVAHDREHLFDPIQEALRNRFGFFTTKLLLSDRLVKDIAMGTTSLRDLPPYRLNLFRQTADELGLDFSAYEVEASGKRE